MASSAVVEAAVVVAVVLAVVVVDEEMVAGEGNPDFAGELSMPSPTRKGAEQIESKTSR